MDLELLNKALVSSEYEEPHDQETALTLRSALRPGGIKKVRDRTLSYTHRHRGNWFKPEYDFEEIQIVQDVDSYTARAIKKKIDRLLIAGWDFVGMRDEPVNYIKQRIAFMEIATNKPFVLLISETASDLVRFGNSMWIKTRDKERSPGNIRTDIRMVELEPVAGYHIIPFETLEFKTAKNGEHKKIMQNLQNGETLEFFPVDTIHFYTNRKPGFSVGTPELFPALDDIALLRRLEENVEDLVENNLFPVFHYRIGNDNFPERYGPDGVKESDVVKQTIEYMPPGAIYVSDHRHEITAIGSESKALVIDSYLDYFKKRVFAALGVSPIDMGEASANRSTASTLSKGMLMDVEALQYILKTFIDFYVINELLLEGGFNVLDESERVYIQFGVIDKEERIAFENHQVQMFMNNSITQNELRKVLRLRPMIEADQEDTFFERYTKPLAELKSFGFTNEPTGSASASNSKQNPSNQHGTRTSPKLTHDIEKYVYEKLEDFCNDENLPDLDIEYWEKQIINRYNELANTGVALDTIIQNVLLRIS